MGAVCSFAAAYTTGSALLGILAGLYAGVGMSMLFAFLTQTLMTSQVATGLSLTLLGLGLSGPDRRGVHGAARGEARIDPHPPPERHPLHRTDPVRPGYPGLRLPRADRGHGLCAVSHPDRPRHQRGGQQSPLCPCARLQRDQGALSRCIVFGGACSGLAGAYLALAYTTQWIESMSAGRGWIALALVVFSTWLPMAPAYRGLSLRHGLDHGPLRPGYGRRDPVAAIVVLALPRHDSGAGNHLREQVFDQGEHARMHRAALRAREVEGE